MVPFFPRSRGPAAASSLSMEGTTVDLEPGRADGHPLSILSMAANSGLCCHLIYFFLPMLIACNVFSSMVSGREHWTRKARLRPQVCSCLFFTKSGLSLC